MLTTQIMNGRPRPPTEENDGENVCATGGPASSEAALSRLEIDLHELVDRIRAGDPSGMEDLYHVFSRGVRYYLCRQLGSQEIDDKVHDTLVIVVLAIRRGDLRDPERLLGFMRTVVRRQVAAHIDNAVHTRRDMIDLETGAALALAASNPESTAIFQQKAEFMKKVLLGMPERDREILTRFYLDEQPQDQICEEMSLTGTQFRLLKSRAKTRFGELGRKKLSRKSIRAVFMRNSLTA
ncbi:MAG TPA: sigma-70 family RNA polymerase sigma factor [Bryobacteraceae bacterium]|nr:sigma-70 family RNA polymerase sigma factor [Bryobacteraceae bacterium]